MYPRTELLAKYNPRLYTPKFEEPPPHQYKDYPRPITPIKNERIEMLSKQTPYKITPKYQPGQVPTNYIDKAVLEATLTPRLDHLSRPFVTKLKATRQAYSHLGKQFTQTMGEKIQMSMDTIYYHNMKSKMAIEAEKKEKRKKPKRKRIWDEKNNRLSTLAIPRRIHKPPPPPKRKRKPLKFMKEKLGKLAQCPSRLKYKRPSQDSFVKEQRHRLDLAVKHTTSKREKELNQVPKHWLVKPPKIYFGVKPSARKTPSQEKAYEVPERTKELAAPRPRANAPEMDLKDHPYDISPAALKYKATPRIIKLAKPIER